MDPALQFVVFVVALIGLWFVLTRNARASQRAVATLQSEIEIGDEVILSAGIFGTVHALDDDRVQIEIAEGTVITVARQVVVRRAPEDQREDPGTGAEAPAPPTDEQHPDTEEKQDRG